MKLSAFSLLFLAATAPAAIWLSKITYYRPLTFITAGLLMGVFGCLVVKVIEDLRRRPIIFNVHEGGKLEITDGRTSTTVEGGQRLRLVDSRVRNIRSTGKPQPRSPEGAA